MRCILRKSFLISAVVLSFLFIATAVHADPLKFSSSTQFLWGDDELGGDQSIFAQYLMFTFAPEGKPYSMTGYGRIWKDFGSPDIRSSNPEGRLYYLYLDYALAPEISTRIGRQYMNFTANSSLMDGFRLDVSKIGPLGITVAAGRDVVYSLDSEFSQSGNYVVGIDVHLEKMRPLQLGASYVRKYDDSDLAREELGGNFRYIYKFLSPYGEVRYDLLAYTFDEQTYGLDVFPMSNLMIKGEFYQVYPTFDATSIYSVFAVDKYQEYLVRAEYSFKFPVTAFASYKRQVYEEADDADVYSVGARVYPMSNLTFNVAFNYRMGYSGFDAATGESDGKLVGYEFSGNYRFMKELQVFGGLQYNTYNRPELNGLNSATKFWAGGQWAATKSLTLTARIEDNINENFDHRTLGRVTLDWNL